MVQLMFAALLFICSASSFGQAAIESSPTQLLLGQSPARLSPIAVEHQVQRRLGEMTQDEKLSLIGGTGAWDVRPLPRLGLPRLYGTDSAAGVRQSTPPGVSYPSSIMLAATWSSQRNFDVGQALARDARATGFQAVLGPGMNLNRIAFAGRQAEYGAGEDPYLGAALMPALINGIQSQGVWATAKHLVANDQELNRMSIDISVDERTLREVYLLPFESAVKSGQVASIMCAFNKVNGLNACENRHLLTDIVKRDWAFQGFVESDYDSIHDGVAAAIAGSDLDMPAGNKMNRATLQAALQSGALTQASLDDKVRRILRQTIRFGFDRAQPIPINRAPSSDQRPVTRSDMRSDMRSVTRSDMHSDTRPHTRPDTQSDKAALNAAREGVVLLTNPTRLLPLSTIRPLRIAVVGHRALSAPPQVYGSAYLAATRFVSLVNGLRALAPNGSSVDFIDAMSLDPRNTQSQSGFVGHYFGNDQFAGPPLRIRTDRQINFDWGSGTSVESTKTALENPEANIGSIEWTGQIVPQITGQHVFKVRADGAVQILVNGIEIASNGDGQPIVATIPPTVPVTGRVELSANNAATVQIRYKRKAGYGNSLGAMRGVQFSWASLQAPTSLSNFDAVVVAAGLGHEYEGEGFDRPFEMPEYQAKLIANIAAVNPRTVALIHAGGPVALRGFADRVGALLYAWYPGQFGGQAVAEVLFGKVNPSGKLPVSLDTQIEGNPAFASYPTRLNDPAALAMTYSEGPFVGYKGYDRRGTVPLFAFGHGLSYAKFAYSSITIRSTAMRCDREQLRRPQVVTNTIRAQQIVHVSFDVKNTSSVAGFEVAQVYVGQHEPSIDRPVKELKGFAKIMIPAGQHRRLSIKLNPRAFAYYDVRRSVWATDAADFLIWVGGASNALSAPMRIRHDAEVIAVRDSAPTMQQPLVKSSAVCFD